MHQLWPFGVEKIVDGAFVSKLSHVEEGQLVPIYHFVLSYARSLVGVPILVRQTAIVLDDGSTHQELWAVLVRTDRNDADLPSLCRHPFWFHTSELTHATRDGDDLRDSQRTWFPGEALDIRTEFQHADDTLIWLWDGNRPKKRQKVVEHVNLLQHSAIINKQHDEFEEICDYLVSTHEQTKDEVEIPQPITELEDLVKALLQPTWIGLNYDFEILQSGHPAIAYAIACTPLVSESSGTHFHIFTDGSSKNGQGAWAFVVLVQIGSGSDKLFGRVAFAGDKIVSENGQATTAAEAESWALIAMSDYLLSRPWTPGMQIHCHYDAKVIGEAAWGLQNVPQWKTSEGTTPRFARTMLVMVQRKFTAWKALHVHAHEGNPYNECADTLATMIREDRIKIVKPQLRIEELRQHPLREWAWLQVHPTQELPDLVTMLRDTQQDDDKGWLDSVFSPLTQQQDEKPKCKQQTIRCATVNVGSFHYGQDQNQPVSLKAQEIAQQAAKQNIAILALQETRARHSCAIRTGCFDRVVVAADKGHAGVEIWFHVDILGELGQKTFDGTKNVATWHAEPTLLAIHLDCGAVQIDIVNIYAPQSGHDEASIKAWWCNLDKVLDSRSWASPCILVGDFNAKVGSVQNEQIGPCSPDFENPAGEACRELCTKHCLWIPTTWDEIHQGPSWTYIGPKGGKSRLDYFAVSEDIRTGVYKTELDQSIDVMNGDRDHFVLTMDLQLTFELPGRNCLKRAPRYNRNKSCSINHDLRPDVVQSLPDIPWKTNVVKHWSIVRDHMQTEAAKHFPLQKRKKRQTYMSEEAWNVLCDRKDVHKLHRHQQQILLWHLLRGAFRARRDGSNVQDDGSNLASHTLRLQEAITYEQRCKLESKFQTIKRRDWKLWIQKVLADKVDAANQVSCTDMYKLLQPKKMVQRAQGRLKIPLPGMIDAQGQICLTREQVALKWQAQFSEVENAVSRPPHNLLNLDQHDAPKQSSWDDVSKIPSLLDLEWAIRTMKSKRAPGLDGLGAELFQAREANTSMRMYALFMKTALRQQYIPELTGGWLLALFKGKGNPRHMDKHRGIMLEPTLSRCFSRAWRGRISQGLSSIAEPGQWGGRAGMMSCTGLHLEVRMWQNNAKMLRKAQAVVFVDIQAAFYSIAKALVASTDTTQQEYHDLCANIGVPETAKGKFWRNLQRTNAIKTSTKSDICTAIAAQTLKTTWFAIPDGDRLQFPTTGCRPGDPLADLYFSSVLAFVLEEIHQRLAQEQVIAEQDDAGNVACSVTWVDDIAFNVTGDAATIVQKTIHLLAIVIDVTTEFGLTLSYGPSKTTALITFRGSGSAKARQQFEKQYQGKLPTMSEHRGLQVIETTTHYKHLGGYLTTKGSLLQEIKVRGAQAAQKLQAMTKILKNPVFEIKHKQVLFKSMGLAVMTLHSGSWWGLTEGEYRAWQGAWFQLTGFLYQRLPDGEVPHCSFQQRSHDAQCPMPMELLMLHKLKLVAQILRDADPFIIEAILNNHAIAQHESWLASLNAAVKWLIEQVGPTLITAKMQDLNMPGTWADLQPQAKKLAKLVKKAEKAHMLRVRMFCELQQADVEQRQLLADMGWVHDLDMSEQHVHVQEVSGMHDCALCGSSFKSAAALAVHQQRRHGERIAVRRVLADDRCRACKKRYFTRARALVHLHAGNTDCWIKLLRNTEPMTIESMEALDKRDRETGTAIHQKKFKDWHDEQACRPCTDDELQDQLPVKQPWHEVNDELPTEIELTEWRKLGMLPPGKGGREKTKRGESQFSISNVLHEAQELERRICEDNVHWNPNFDRIPPPMVVDQKYVLLFFSGRRRLEDIAHYIHEGSNLCPISIDTAVSAEHGDMYKTDLWVQLIKQRKVAAGHGGPPCETYSMARWNQCLPEGGPKPLRTSQFPWGLPELSYKELVQMLNGSCLMFRTIFLLMLIHAFGGGTSLEHPKGPEQHQVWGWSIWMSGFIRRWLLDNNVRMLQFAQGPLGREFMKPT